MSHIPISPDTALVTGEFAQQVDNRSLLLDKFPLPKTDTGNRRFDDASRWSLLRVASGGALLAQDAADKGRRANGRNTTPENREKFLQEENIARKLAATATPPRDLASIRQKHALRMRELVEKSFPGAHRTFMARLEGRLALNLAEGIIENAGISLDRLFGDPMIPASALKGITRNAALWEVRRTDDPIAKREKLKLLATVFGFSIIELRDKGDFAWALGSDGGFEDFARELKDSLPKGIDAKQGGISFLPAHPVSEKAEVVVDLTNVHYPDYYQRASMSELTKEKPRPNPFPVVEKDAVFSFLFVLNELGRRNPMADKLLEAANGWMKVALTENGVGAKTAAGYGWFSIVEGDDPLARDLEVKRQKDAAAAIAAEEKREAEAREKERLESLSPVDRAAIEYGKLDQQAFAEALKALPENNEDQQRGYFQVLLSEGKKKTLKNWMKKKPKNKETINELSNKLGIKLP
jgi:CRISPR-associated protein Cmr6